MPHYLERGAVTGRLPPRVFRKLPEDSKRAQNLRHFRRLAKRRTTPRHSMACRCPANRRQSFLAPHVRGRNSIKHRAGNSTTGNAGVYRGAIPRQGRIAITKASELPSAQPRIGEAVGRWRDPHKLTSAATALLCPRAGRAPLHRWRDAVYSNDTRPVKRPGFRF